MSVPKQEPILGCWNLLIFLSSIAFTLFTIFTKIVNAYRIWCKMKTSINLARDSINQVLPLPSQRWLYRGNIIIPNCQDLHNFCYYLERKDLSRPILRDMNRSLLTLNVTAFAVRTVNSTIAGEVSLRSWRLSWKNRYRLDPENVVIYGFPVEMMVE